jgi:hypothetical protein
MVALLALSCSDPVPLPPTPTPTPQATVVATSGDLEPVASPGPGDAEPTPTPTPRPIPAALQGVPVAPLRLGDAAPFPADLALIIEVSCPGCRGITDGLFRAYRDPFGSLAPRPSTRCAIMVCLGPPRTLSCLSRKRAGS